MRPVLVVRISLLDLVNYEISRQEASVSVEYVFNHIFKSLQLRLDGGVQPRRYSLRLFPATLHDLPDPLVINSSDYSPDKIERFNPKIFLLILEFFTAQDTLANKSER